LWLFEQTKPNTESEVEMKRSVGLLVMTAINSHLVALLSKRGVWNYEKSGFESWPGACQLTAHGKAEEGEDIEANLEREVNEELGVLASRRIFENGWGKIKELNRKENAEKLVVNFAVWCESPEILEVITPERSSGGIYAVRRYSFELRVKNIADFDKEIGIPNDYRATIAMFPDEIEAVRKTFGIFA